MIFTKVLQKGLEEYFQDTQKQSAVLAQEMMWRIQKVSIGISASEYENQSKYYSTTIHNHTELCGDAAGATSATTTNEEESQKDHEQTMHDAATKRTDDSKLVSYRMVMGRLI